MTEPMSSSPIDAAAEAKICACFSLRKAARAVTQLYDATLRQSGLRTTQFTLLLTLSRAGPVTIGTLAERLVMDRTTLTRNLKPLIGRGLIAVSEGEDRRSRIVELTEEGGERLAAALPLWQRAQGRFLDGLGRGNWSGLLGGLKQAVAVARTGASSDAAGAAS